VFNLPFSRPSPDPAKQWQAQTHIQTQITKYAVHFQSDSSAIQTLPADNSIRKTEVTILAARYCFWRHSDDKTPICIRTQREPILSVSNDTTVISNVICKYCKLVCLRPDTNTFSTKANFPVISNIPIFLLSHTQHITMFSLLSTAVVGRGAWIIQTYTWLNYEQKIKL
jgi:hypothetical protein